MAEKITTEERVKIVEFFFESQKSVVSTQRKFRRHFHKRNAPARTTIMAIVRRFQTSGSIDDQKRTGRPLTARTETNKRRVSRSVRRKLETSIRRRSEELSMSLQLSAKDFEKGTQIVPV